MMRGRVGVIVLCGALLSAVGVGAPLYSLQTANAATTATSTLDAQIAAHNQQIAQLNQEIAKYQAEIKKAGADKQTLQTAINKLDLKKKEVETQIAITQRQISTTQIQINHLSSKISVTQQAVNADQLALAEDLRSVQMADSQSLVEQVFSSNSLASVWNDVSASLQVQRGIQDHVAALKQQKQNLAATQAETLQKKTTLVSQKQDLASQNTSLAQTKNSKTRLLQETNAKESNYEKLLKQAEAELASFSKFTQNAGGSGLLTNQTKCDSWGCYYNQRDAAWGNMSLDGTKYLLKSDGCLITAMAMVMTHYGYRNVTPVTINSNPGNFAAYYPAYLLLTIHVDGVSATRKAAYIDSTLRTGNPVIVGLNAYGGTHFVVLVSGSHGNYIMKDPYVPNGNDIPFSSHYSMRQIFGIRKVVVSK